MKYIFNILTLFAITILVLSCSDVKKRRNVLEPLSSTSDNSVGILISEDSINNLLVNNTKEPYSINIPLEPKFACLDTIICSYDFIPLEISEKCIVGNITKIIPCNNCFCILDRDNKNVFIFEMDGHFRCKLGEKGHGPKEHVDAWNIAYNEKDKSIALLDLAGRKLQHFDLYGNLLQEQPLYLLFTDFEYLDEDIILFTGNSYNTFSEILDLYQIVVVDKNLKPKSRGCKTTNKVRQDFSYSAVLKKYDNKVLYNDLLSDTLWNINQAQKMPFVVMNIEGNQAFSQYEKMHITDDLYKEHKKNNTNVSNCFVTSKYISLIYSSPRCGGLIQNLIYSRESGLYKIIGFNENPKRLGDYLAKAGFDGVFSNNAFLKIIQPTSIMEAIGHEEIIKNLTVKEQKMVKDLSMESNPVVMIEHLIDF